MTELLDNLFFGGIFLLGFEIGCISDPMLLFRIFDLDYLLLEPIFLSKQISLKLYLLINLIFLHQKYHILIIWYSFDHKCHNIVQIDNNLVILIILLISSIEGIHQSTEKLASWYFYLVLYEDCRIDQQFKFTCSIWIFHFLNIAEIYTIIDDLICFTCFFYWV